MNSLSGNKVIDSIINQEGNGRDVLNRSAASATRKGLGNQHVFEKGGEIIANTEDSLKYATRRLLENNGKVASGELKETSSSLSIIVESRSSEEMNSILCTGPVLPSKLISLSTEVVLPIIEELFTSATESIDKPSLEQSHWISEQLSEASIYSREYNTSSINIKYGNSITNTSKRKQKRRPVSTSVRGLHNVVTHLGLPIFVTKPQPFMDEEVVMERILLDTENNINDIEFKRDEIEKHRKEKTTKRDNSHADVNENHILSPFEMVRCFGFNPEVPSINISFHDKTAVLFTNSQFLVLYNIKEDIMSFLHGHQNNVTCIAIDSQGTIIASGDKGTNCRVVIWDTSPRVMEILENEYLQGVELLAISCDGEYLITVSPLPEQRIQLWNWKVIITQPVSSVLSNINHGTAKKLVVHTKCPEEFCVVYENGIEFIRYDKENLNKTEAFHGDYHQNSNTLGIFTHNVFLHGHETAAISSTSKGYAVVWVDDESKQIKQRKINKKNVRLHSELITHIVSVDNLIATATVTGKISFFDKELTVLYWTHKLPFGELISLSFNLAPSMMNENYDRGKDELSRKTLTGGLVDATLKNRPLHLRPFIVTSVKGKMVYLNLNKAESTELLFSPDAIYTAMDIHPKYNYLCAGTSQGQCLLIDFLNNKIKVSHKIYSVETVCQAVSFIKYSPLGNYIACGMYTGTVWVLDPLLLTPILGSPLTELTTCVIKMVFSDDDTFLAVTDQSYCLTVYKLGDKKIVVIGEYLVHSNYIIDIIFASDIGNTRKLYTIAEDRRMVEFSIPEEGNTLKFITVHRIEQTAIPTCIIPHPTLNTVFLMANSEMKFKLLRKSDLRCCKTVQAPNLGFPITYVHEMQRYLLFGTAYHIGLHILPLDGNPYKSLAYFASSSPIVCIRVNSSGKYLFTISENSTAINMWKINTSAVERFFSRGGEGVDAFLSVLKGRENGIQEKDLRDFFLIGNFLHQGETPGVVRRLYNTIHVCEIASIFQALGYFLTKEQLDNMIYELTGGYVPPNNKTIHFEEFIQLFINHRPNIQLSIGDIHEAFRDFHEGVYLTNIDYKPPHADTDTVFESSTFVEKLSETGDKIPYEDISNALSILCGDCSDVMYDDYDPSLPFMPRKLHFKTFLTDILGFNTTGD